MTREVSIGEGDEDVNTTEALSALMQSEIKSHAATAHEADEQFTREWDAVISRMKTQLRLKRIQS